MSVGVQSGPPPVVEVAVVVPVVGPVPTDEFTDVPVPPPPAPVVVPPGFTSLSDEQPWAASTTRPTAQPRHTMFTLSRARVRPRLSASGPGPRVGDLESVLRIVRLSFGGAARRCGDDTPRHAIRGQGSQPHAPA